MKRDIAGFAVIVFAIAVSVILTVLIVMSLVNLATALVGV